jgi:hypothetical protein
VTVPLEVHLSATCRGSLECTDICMADTGCDLGYTATNAMASMLQTGPPALENSYKKLLAAKLLGLF